MASSRTREDVRETAPKAVDHPRFHGPDAEEFVREAENEGAASAAAASEKRRDDARGGHGLPGHLRALCRAPLLTPAEERALFLRMNFERHRAATLHDDWIESDDEHARRERDAAFERAEAARDRIVLANTRLVVALARKFVMPSLSFDELLAAGLEPLLRSVDLFDVSRGFRFSTYATWAVRNHMLRLRKRDQADRQRFRTGDEAPLDDLTDSDVDTTAEAERTAIAATRIGRILDRLEDRDRTIVEARFGLNGHRRGQTYAEIGKLVGLSKERARQLANRAIDRLREQPDVERLIGV